MKVNQVFKDFSLGSGAVCKCQKKLETSPALKVMEELWSSSTAPVMNESALAFPGDPGLTCLKNFQEEEARPSFLFSFLPSIHPTNKISAVEQTSPHPFSTPKGTSPNSPSPGLPPSPLDAEFWLLFALSPDLSLEVSPQGISHLEVSALQGCPPLLLSARKGNKRPKE